MCLGLVWGSFWWLEEEHREGYKEWRKGEAYEKTKLFSSFKTANGPNHTKKEISIASKLSVAKKKKEQKELLLKLYIHMVSKN